MNDPPRAASVIPPPMTVATSMTTARAAPRTAAVTSLAAISLARTGATRNDVVTVL